MSVISTRRIGITITTIAAFVAAISATELHAQEEPEDRTNARLKECDRIADPAARLECFDVVVRGLNQPPEPPQESRAEPPTVQEAVPQTPVQETAPQTPVQRAAPRTPAPVATATPGNATSSTSDVTRSDAPDVQTASAENVEGPANDSIDSAPRVGEANEDTPDIIRATIVEVRAMNNGRFEARLDNGQVWRETEASRVRMPKAGSSVVITKGRLGSYRMKINNDNRRAGVRRTK